MSKVKGEIKLDGDLGKYEGIESITLKNPQDIYPRDVIRSETGLLTGEDDIGVKFYMAGTKRTCI